MNIREIPEHELARLREKAKEISGSQSDYHSSYTELLSRRLNGEPLQYIEEYIPFYSIQINVDQRCLIPRPETEILVDYVNNHFSSPIKVLDAGTGSGCIGISIALKNPSSNVYGSDHSVDALNVALINKNNLNVNNFSLVHADWLSSFKKASFDLIVTNPPYIADQDPHLENLQHEPNKALVAKDNGLQDIRLIIEQSTEEGRLVDVGTWISATRRS